MNEIHTYKEGIASEKELDEMKDDLKPMKPLIRENALASNERKECVKWRYSKWPFDVHLGNKLLQNGGFASRELRSL